MKNFINKQCPECKLWMDDLKGHKCSSPDSTKIGSHWNYRVCRFKSPEGYDKLGVFEVYYDDKGEPTMRSADPELSWFIENCGDENTEESCAKAAQWELKCMLKAFRAPILDAKADFQ